jgi:periplasmic protein TonB
LVYPRQLAVRLEQGETILHFVVQPDGKLGDAVQVVKSSGFVEFDQAALDAVRKALPFRPMPDAAHARSLPVRLPVTFSNPVIR